MSELKDLLIQCLDYCAELNPRISSSSDVDNRSTFNQFNGGLFRNINNSLLYIYNTCIDENFIINDSYTKTSGYQSYYVFTDFDTIRPIGYPYGFADFETAIPLIFRYNENFVGQRLTIANDYFFLDENNNVIHNFSGEKSYARGYWLNELVDLSLKYPEDGFSMYHYHNNIAEIDFDIFNIALRNKEEDIVLFLTEAKAILEYKYNNCRSNIYSNQVARSDYYFKIKYWEDCGYSIYSFGSTEFFNEDTGESAGWSRYLSIRAQGYSSLTKRVYETEITYTAIIGYDEETFEPIYGQQTTNTTASFDGDGITGTYSFSFSTPLTTPNTMWETVRSYLLAEFTFPPTYVEEETNEVYLSKIATVSNFSYYDYDLDDNITISAIGEYSKPTYDDIEYSFEFYIMNYCAYEFGGDESKYDSQIEIVSYVLDGVVSSSNVLDTNVVETILYENTLENGPLFYRNADYTTRTLTELPDPTSFTETYDVFCKPLDFRTLNSDEQSLIKISVPTE